MKIAARAKTAQPFHAMSIGERAGILQAEGHSIAKLSLGEPDFGAPPAVREEMRRVMDGRPLPYSPALGLLALREAIAGFYRDRHGVEVDPERIVVTTGASAALLLVAAATTEPGDDVVIADPSYPCNRQLVETYGGRIVLAPTSPASRYQMDRASAESVWTPQTSAVMLATPSNPTGTSIPFEELASICALARERRAWRIVDEIYLGLLNRGRSAQEVVDRQVLSGLHQLLGKDRPAQAPPRHPEVLGEGVDDDRLGVGLQNTVRRRAIVIGIGQPQVDLVDDPPGTAFARQCADRCQLLEGIDVPVGLDGVASITALVCGVHAASAEARSIW